MTFQNKINKTKSNKCKKINKKMSKNFNLKLICCVEGCLNIETDKTSLFTFPADPVDQLQWKVILKIEKPISSFFRVCSEHFKESDFMNSNELKPDSLPTQNIPDKEIKIEEVHQNVQRTSKRIHIRKCAICKEIINSTRFGVTLKSAGSQANRKKWIKILKGRTNITTDTSICYSHFKSSDFLPSKQNVFCCFHYSNSFFFVNSLLQNLQEASPNAELLNQMLFQLNT